MDRDKRWERVQLAHDLFLEGKGAPVPSAEAALAASYAAGVTDEFVKPVVLPGITSPVIRDGDVLFFFNFRADRSASARILALLSLSANASTSRSLARNRFASRVRSSCATTRIPVGTCRNTTLVSTFCTFCPPRPPDLENSSTKSLSSIGILGFLHN